MRTRPLAAAAVATVAAGGLAVVATRVVASSDLATTQIRVAAQPPEPSAPASLPATVRPRWTAATVPNRLASAPVEGPTAVVAGPDRLAGLDPATGRERWSYRRGNARLCSWTLQDGAVVAAFAKSSGCRDLIALDAATGGRRWYRTLEVATDTTLTSGPGVAIATAGAQLVAVDTATGLDRWTYAAAGCRLDPAVVGRAAAVAVAHCGDRLRLIGHDPYADKKAWTVPQEAGSDPRVVSGEGVAAVLSRAEGRPALTLYDGTGRRLRAVSDHKLAYGPDSPVTGATVTSDADPLLVVWTGRLAVAVDSGTGGRGRVVWTAPATGPPAVVDDDVVLADRGGFVTRPAATGAPATRARVTGGDVPSGAALSRIGRLIITAAGGRVAAYG